MMRIMIIVALNRQQEKLSHRVLETLAVTGLNVVGPGFAPTQYGSQHLNPTDYRAC